MDHLRDNDLINSSQHGFLPKRSCTTNLLDFFENVTKNIDKGDPVDVSIQSLARQGLRYEKVRDLDYNSLLAQNQLVDRD